VRIDFAGGWSDVPEFADVEGGAVVNAAITLFTHVEGVVGGGSYSLHAEDLGERVSLQSPADARYDGRLDLHKAALNMLPVAGGLELLSSSDVPVGSGLGASGSLDVALLQALAMCRQERLDPVDLAEMGFLLETSELKLLGGRQDQYAAALGGINRFRFGAGSEVDVRRVEVSSETASEFAEHLTLVYTGESHFSSQTHDRVWQSYREQRDEIGDAIRTMRDLVDPLARAIEAGNWREVARLVDENWTQQQRLDVTISTEGTRSIEAAARSAGAWGVKATGAGAGGCLVILGPRDRHAAIEQAVVHGGGCVLKWTFDFEGVTGWHVEDDADNRTG
jgi:D-glycero-alpha-D-manno-heptose-7-phosphate kinase